MTVGLLLDCDNEVAAHLYASYNQPHFKFDKCLGIVKNGKLVGAVLFTSWNGHNIEIGYYGKNTMTAGIIRALARYGIKHFDPARCTVITSKRNKHFIRGLQRLGFKLEGASRCYYGKDDTIRNTGVRFVMFRDRIDELAKIDVESLQCS